MTTNRQRGSATIISLLVTVMLTLLGISFLFMGAIENRIAENERMSLQAVFTGEAGVRQVKRWFDRPGGAENLLNPPLNAIDRTLRMIDSDGDPATPPIDADGSAGKPFYKQGVDRDADGADDVFEKPYRNSLADTLLGTEDGPDMRIDEASSADARAFLRDLSDRLLLGYPAGDRGGLLARISRIDVYAPPTIQKGGAWLRFGMATVKVIARIYQELPDGSETVLAERMVRVVLNEIPFNPGDLGPLHSCDLLQWNGDFTVHWGIATAVSDADLHANHDKLGVSYPRGAPGTNVVDLLWGWDNPASFAAYKAAVDGLEVQDPWLRVKSGGDMTEVAGAVEQPYPFDWVVGTPLGDGHWPHHDTPSEDGTHSNVYQNTPVSCPNFPYELWKSIARSGTPDVHYYVWDNGTQFREDGIGPLEDFRDITDNQTGVFFFDTKDQVAPFDADADGEYDNLTPKIKMRGGVWGTRGMVYLNSLSFQSHGVKGRDAIMNAPGEPFQDADQDGRWDSGENWMNLSYPTRLRDPFVTDASDTTLDDGTVGAVAVRNAWGPDIKAQANVWGILYNNGYYDATGNALYYGTVISKMGIGEFDPSGGTPDHYWDESLRRNWPPDTWGIPRVAITRWETDQ